jgi:hypothetical protein
VQTVVLEEKFLVERPGLFDHDPVGLADVVFDVDRRLAPLPVEDGLE